MIKHFKPLFFFFFTILSQQAWSYIDLSAGYAGFRTNVMKDKNISLIGQTQRVAFGGGGRSINAEFFYQKTEAKGDILPDNTPSELTRTSNSYGLQLSTFVNSMLGFNVGYSKTKTRYNLSTSSNSSYTSGVVRSFGLKGSTEDLDCTFFGAQLMLTRNSKFDVYFKGLNHFYSGIDGSELILYLGIKFNTNLGLDSL